MSLGRTVLKTICALSTVVAVGAGSVAAIAPTFAATGTGANSADASASADTTVTDVVLDWGVNPESGGGSYAGGCNALSAGTAGNAGGATIWTADSVDTDGEPLYRTVDESAHAQILKPDANGDLRQVSGFDARCTNRNGTSISGKTGGLTFTPQGATDAEPTYSENIVRLTGGTGTVNAAAGTAHIEWKNASFTIVYYGGMTYWSIADPVLDIKDGKGTLTGTATGYGADRNDPGKWSTLEAVTIHLADFTTGTGNGDADQIVFGNERIDAQPDYLGVDVGEGQTDRTDANAAWWGSFPESWVAFNKLTGQTSYWYTTDGGSDSIQPRKVASPISITWGEAAPAPDTPSNPGSGSGGDGSGGGSGDNSGNGENGGSDADGSGSGNGGNTGSGNGSGDDSGSGNGGNGSGDSGNDNAGGSGDSNGGGNATVTYSNVTLRWGMNDETNSASYYGDCNFLSAGKAGNTGSAKVWTKDLYKAVDGNVSIEKPNSSGQWVRASWDSRCLTRSGDGVTMGKRADGRSINTESQVVIANGSGVMAADGSVTISWKGSWTVAYYGGMTYWSVTDPTLTLDANGNGALTATASGYGSSMTDSGKWVTLSSRTIHVADITGVNLSQAESAHGFTVTPNYLGVAVTASGDHGGQAAKDDGNASYWGSFPQSFVDFQMETGQSAYWYTAGGARDFAKVTLPMSVQFDASYTVDVPADSPAAATAAGAAASSASGSSSSTSSSGGSGSSASSGVASASGSTGNKSSASAKKTDGQQGNDASGNDNGGSRAGRSSASDDGPLAEAGTVTLIEDNARTIAAGSAGVAAATAMPLGCGWLIRRRLGLDPSDALDRLLAGR
ncbi:hypothetical protein JS532_07080 [Bifidobacterium callimiconis]|uniref:hypothetical protein n=1 Tax=Bifidobacterium callimiconis TaxID=2306973 RepID=UPI001BDC22CA|nr:hypothetical protein [Bifidobacterium callimiconis]MBT1177329.1 hypothetical protein [Bifidobacterium callimiconis]